jgi:hypothetical protein
MIQKPRRDDRKASLLYGEANRLRVTFSLRQTAVARREHRRDAAISGPFSGIIVASRNGADHGHRGCKFCELVVALAEIMVRAVTDEPAAGQRLALHGGCVMIDSAYDGKMFNITVADVPEKKNDPVKGKNIVDGKKGATVAVKVTDMLGEEALVVKSV